MSGELSTIERAFQLADGGKCRSMDDLRAALARERLTSIDAHLAGSTIRRQLQARMQAAIAHAKDV